MECYYIKNVVDPTRIGKRTQITKIDIASYLELLDLLKRFEETDYVLALFNAGIVDEMGCSVGAVNLVAFVGFSVSDAAFFKHWAAVAVSRYHFFHLFRMFNGINA